jgi:hypothetical protein
MATPNNQFRLRLAPQTTYNFSVDWGDGSSEIVNLTTFAYNYNNSASWPGITHTYATPGMYQVAITENVEGGFPRIRFNGVDTGTNTPADESTNDFRKVKKIVQWGTNKWTDLVSSFEGCTALQIVATDNLTNRISGVSDFTKAWQNCRSLSSFPLIDTSGGTNFSYTWHNCVSLSTFPSISTQNATSLFASWMNCISLTGFPSINTRNVANFERTWGIDYEYNSMGLLSFPFIDTSKGTNFSHTWYRNRMLSSFPQIDVLSGTNFLNTWRACSQLTAFPVISTGSNCSILDGTWYDCMSLREFPSACSFPTVKTFNYTWYNCKSLKNFPDNLITLSATVLAGTWQNCSGLTAFPCISAYTKNVTSFAGAWAYCSSLSSFPSTLIDITSATNFANTWAGCVNLKEIDPNFNFSKAVYLNGTFADCRTLTATPTIDCRNAISIKDMFSMDPYVSDKSKLKSVTLTNTEKVTDTISGLFCGCWNLEYVAPFNIPLQGTTNSDIFGTFKWCEKLKSVPYIELSATRELREVWHYCRSLSSFPLLNTRNVWNYRWTWMDCVSLSSFPQIDTLSATNFDYTWSGCTALTGFPPINTSNVTNFGGAWNGCTRLSLTDFPTLNMSKMTNGTNCFNNVKLTTSSYSSLLTSICATNFNTSVTFDGGLSTYNTPASAARVYLVNTKGWTITDGGYQVGT